MSEFRTTFALPVAPFQLAPERGKLLLLGSCFTTEIGERLQACGYPCAVNPAGVQYNPASIARLMRCALSGEIPAEYFFEFGGLRRCWLMPTAFSAPTALECRQKCLDAIGEIRLALIQAEALIVTLGSAWIYEHTATAGLEPMAGQFCGLVSNCHKVPAREFLRRRLSVEEIAADWLALLSELRSLNPGLKVIFTVSPIRHFKDGAHENTLSKATLHLAVSQITEVAGKDATSRVTDYFPAFELLFDDLRDYRFYAGDMLHPSPEAVDYIFRHFAGYYFTADTRAQLEAQAARLRRQAHRPILPPARNS